MQPTVYPERCTVVLVVAYSLNYAVKFLHIGIRKSKVVSHNLVHYSALSYTEYFNRVLDLPCYQLLPKVFPNFTILQSHHCFLTCAERKQIYTTIPHSFTIQNSIFLMNHTMSNNIYTTFLK